MIQIPRGEHATTICVVQIPSGERDLHLKTNEDQGYVFPDISRLWDTGIACQML